jgi:hypothetical protein
MAVPARLWVNCVCENILGCVFLDTDIFCGIQAVAGNRSLRDLELTESNRSVLMILLGAARHSGRRSLGGSRTWRGMMFCTRAPGLGCNDLDDIVNQTIHLGDGIFQ